jgi:hypothetical protein
MLETAIDRYCPVDRLARNRRTLSRVCADLVGHRMITEDLLLAKTD